MEVVWMVSDNFNFFFMFQTCSFLTMVEQFTYQWTWEPYQDGGYYSRKEYQWFLKGCRFSILTCNNFFFFDLSIKNGPNPPKIYQNLIMMVGNRERLWMVSDRIVDFNSSWNLICPISRNVRAIHQEALIQYYQHQSLLNMVRPLYKVVWMVSHRFDNFRFFKKIHRYLVPDIIYSFELSLSMLVLHQESSQSTQGI